MSNETEAQATDLKEPIALPANQREEDGEDQDEPAI